MRRKAVEDYKGMARRRRTGINLVCAVVEP